MGILRTNKISGLETPTPVTGSVSFDGSGDYLSLSDDTQFDFEAGNWTVEGWIYMNSLPSSGNRYTLVSKWTGAGNYSWICNIYNSSGVMQLNFGYTTTGSTATDLYSNGAPSEAGKWFHIAYVRDGSILRQFVNGVQLSTNSISGTIYNGSQNVNIGRHGEDTNYMNGYISNLRILKGTALYTANFTPPVNELQRIGDTVLLCCNNPDSAGAEATGKTITVNGNAAASTFSPGLTRDFTFGTQFGGVAKFDTFGYFVPPSGTTENRFVTFGATPDSSARGLFAGGYNPGATGLANTIEYITISTTGNSSDFGDLSTAPSLGNLAACSSSTRGLFMGGEPNTTQISYVTISSLGNSYTFGQLTLARRALNACSNATRGLAVNGFAGTRNNTIDYVTISTEANALDFGDTLAPSYSAACCASPTRGVFSGGNTPTGITNVIQYVTIASLGNAISFGNLTTATASAGSCSSTTRGLIGGGLNPATTNTIEYITIATLGNSIDFGDLTVARNTLYANSSSVRGVFGGGGGAPSYSNVIDYVTIASTGNALDFGDLLIARSHLASCSDGHGGLG